MTDLTAALEALKKELRPNPPSPCGKFPKSHMSNAGDEIWNSAVDACLSVIQSHAEAAEIKLPYSTATSDARVQKFMEAFGFPDSNTLFTMLKQFENEIRLEISAGLNPQPQEQSAGDIVPGSVMDCFEALIVPLKEQAKDDHMIRFWIDKVRAALQPSAQPEKVDVEALRIEVKNELEKLRDSDKPYYRSKYADHIQSAYWVIDYLRDNGHLKLD